MLGGIFLRRLYLTYVSVAKHDVPSDALPLSIDAIKGEWNVGAKIVSVKVESEAVICVNENGLSSKAVIKDGKAILPLTGVSMLGRLPMGRC